jgi:hypothetical protein
MHRGECKRPATRYRNKTKRQSGQDVASDEKATGNRGLKSEKAENQPNPEPAKQHGDKLQHHIPETPQGDDHAPMSDQASEDASGSTGAHA